jgi:ribosomal protein S18 acetylase RimI-like enzyme
MPERTLPGPFLRDARTIIRLMDIFDDPWLGERFGHPVFTVVAHPTDPEDLVTEVRRHLASQKSASYQAKVPAREVGLLRRLGEAGLQVVNLTIVLGRAPAGLPGGGREGEDVEVREARPGEDDLLAVASRDFTATRFHLDPEIPEQIADGVRRAWVENLLSGKRGDQVIVAERHGRAMGFLSVVRGTVAGEQVREIDLMAVDPQQRGEGIGRLLVSRFLNDSEGRCARVRVGTQAANEGAIRFYERLGFTTEESTYDLHMHVGTTWRG